MTSQHFPPRSEAYLHETRKGPHALSTIQFDEIQGRQMEEKHEPMAKRMRSYRCGTTNGQLQKEYLVPHTAHNMSLKTAILSEFSARNCPGGPLLLPQGGFDRLSGPNLFHEKQEQNPYRQSLSSLLGTMQRESNPTMSMFGGASLSGFPQATGFSGAAAYALMRGALPHYSHTTPMLPPATFFHSMEARFHAFGATPLDILKLSLCNQAPSGKQSATMSGLRSLPSYPTPQLQASMISEKRQSKDLLVYHDQTPIGEWQAPKELPAVLAVPEDGLKLSQHQILLRHQIEAFEATEDDVTTHTRGRNKPIVLGQVGIRCRHCKHLSVATRQKGGVYFPATLLGLYQAAQNMSATHMQCGLCNDMPFAIKNMFAVLMSTKSSSSGTGRHYWAQTAKKIGLIDTDEGIRFGKEVTNGGEPATVEAGDSN